MEFNTGPPGINGTDGEPGLKGSEGDQGSPGIFKTPTQSKLQNIH